MKKIKLIIISSIIISILLFIYCFIPTRLTNKQQLSKDDISIKVHLQVTTGPLYYLKEDKEKLWNTIKDKYPNANPKYVELIGNTPNKFVNDPVFLGDFVVYGHVSETYFDSAEGEVPIFHVVYSDAKLAPFFIDNSQLGTFAFRFVLIFPKIFLTLLVLLICVIVFEHKNKRRISKN
ncbi:hypothetical protein SAMN05444401_3985 [Clostridium amylolyticum]|uniref:Uncharacterized protein n=1 Tax=Clostridium amylolyticum TaxID=1121298 RepID=A0A1M6MFQ3_9CLOT|nr:hypothetical protein [Clostridium amylolyticum]SHJ82278.1 hypothetical protein SAMN05444401_3985 [Clostridium amylolyticum]